MRIEPFYDRTTLVNQTIHTVARNLFEGGALVVLVLLLMLRNLRAASIAALMIPLSMCVALLGMRLANVSGNLMSLGAIDFGLVVDGAIILLENASITSPRSERASAELSIEANVTRWSCVQRSRCVGRRRLVR